MKKAFIIFFSIVFSIYGLINYYIFIHGLQALPTGSYLKYIYIVLFIILSLSFIAGRFIERLSISILSKSLTWIGSFWLAAMVYFFFIVIIIDISRLVNIFLPIFPPAETVTYLNFKLLIFLSSVLLVSLIVAAGYINAKNPVIKTLQIKINKKANFLKSLNIVMVSDIHLGTIIGKKRFDNIVSKINTLNADLVLLAGDVFDEDIKPVIQNNTGETLKNIKSRYGVFGITGNHEYIGGAEKACQYLSEHNVQMLRDSVIKIKDSIYIAGREDKSIKQFARKSRKSLGEILNGVDDSLPVIVMNHQPTEFGEAIKNKVDLHLSGHTHHGQLWPFGFIAKKVYTLSKGYLLKENTHFFVSTGAGTWGPPIRTGNRPEIVNIKLIFN